MERNMSFEKMSFSEALKELKNGKKMQREGWNGKGIFVYLVPGGNYTPQTDVAKRYFKNNPVQYNEYFAIKNVDETVSTWVPSVTDCLAEDWVVI